MFCQVILPECINILVSVRDTRKGVKRRESLALHSEITISESFQVTMPWYFLSHQSPGTDLLWMAMTYILDSIDWWQWLDLNIPDSAYTTAPDFHEPQLILIRITDPAYSTLLFNSTPDFLDVLWMH